MSSPINPLATVAQPPQAPQGAAPVSPLAQLPGYNDAIAQQAQAYLGSTMGQPKSPHDYMLEAMGISPDQEKYDSKKQKFLNRLGVIGQVLAGRNYAQEGQQRYAIAKDAMDRAEQERQRQQNLGLQQAQINRSLAAPYIQNDAELQRQKALDDYNLQLGQRKLKMLQDMGVFDKLDPQMQEMIKAEALTGIKMPSVGMMMRPVSRTGIKAEVFDQQNPGLLKAMGIDPKTSPLLDVTYVNGRPQIIAAKGIAQKVVPGWNGQAEALNPYTLETQALPGVAAPSTAPSTHNELKSVQTVDENGNPITHQFGYQVTSQKTPGAGVSTQAPAAAPGQPAPNAVPGQGAPAEPYQRPAPTAHAVRQASTTTGGGGMDFVKPLTPSETIKTRMNLANTNTNIDRLNRIAANIDSADSTAVAKAITMQADPKTGLMHMILNRNVPLTARQKQLASDLISMREDINGLRGPLGATGFRGPEAFDAMVGQSGSLATNPDVAKGVIKNTLESFNNLKNSYESVLNRRNKTSKASSAPAVLKNPKDPLGIL